MKRKFLIIFKDVFHIKCEIRPFLLNPFKPDVMRYIILFGLFLCIGCSLEKAHADDKVEIKPTKITDNLYMLKGKGGNILICISEKDGVLMIDDQFAPLTDQIMETVGEITELPVQYVVNTHWHGDHTGGNENMGKRGAVIVAHENVRKRMSEEQFNAFFKRKTPPASEEALPTITFTEDMTFYWGEEVIELHHVQNAHTDTDAFVWFPNGNVLHTGDVYFATGYPFIDLSSGGSAQGVIGACKEMLLTINDSTQIVPGHGAISNKEILTDYVNMMETVLGKMEKAIADGKSADEILEMGMTKEFDEQYGDGFIKSADFLLFVYNSLVAE